MGRDKKKKAAPSEIESPPSAHSESTDDDVPIAQWKSKRKVPQQDEGKSRGRGRKNPSGRGGGRKGGQGVSASASHDDDPTEALRYLETQTLHMRHVTRFTDAE